MFWVDYIIFSIIGLSCLIGLTRGFFREILSLVIWSFAVFVSIHYYSYLSIWLTYFEDKSIRNFISFVIQFSLVVIFGSVIGNCMKQFIEKILLLEILDRILGVCFGVLRGVFIVMIVLFFLNMFTGFSNSIVWKESKFIFYFNFIIRWFFNYLEYMLSFFRKIF